MKRTRLSAKRAKPRRTFNPIRLQDGSVKRAEYRVGVDLRRIAAGKPCMVRLDGCDGGGATTILAHYRMPGFCGVGMKPDDLAFGSWACASCARLSGEGTITENRFALAEGVMRTVFALKHLGFVK